MGDPEEPSGERREMRAQGAVAVRSERESEPEWPDDEPGLGWCPLCGHAIDDRAELIPGTPTHRCAAGSELERRIRADAARCGMRRG
jgi:hypothetical protein